MAPWCGQGKAGGGQQRKAEKGRPKVKETMPKGGHSRQHCRGRQGEACENKLTFEAFFEYHSKRSDHSLSCQPSQSIMSHECHWQARWQVTRRPMADLARHHTTTPRLPPLFVDFSIPSPLRQLAAAASAAPTLVEAGVSCYLCPPVSPSWRLDHMPQVSDDSESDLAVSCAHN